MAMWLMLLASCVACAGRQFPAGGADLPAIVRQVDEEAIRQLRRAWILAHGGTASVEEVVLLSRAPDGRLEAILQPHSNLHGRSRFLLPSNTAAIFHTHPNRVLPQPSRDDRRLADRAGIPVFTLSSRGLFVYEPKTGRTLKLMDRLKWLERESWRYGAPMADSAPRP